MRKLFFHVAFQWAVVRRSLIIAAIVGVILVAINHGSCLLAGEFLSVCAVQSGLTFLVPYCVSTVSCVLAHADHQKRTADSAVNLLSKNKVED